MSGKKKAKQPPKSGLAIHSKTSGNKKSSKSRQSNEPGKPLKKNSLNMKQAKSASGKKTLRRKTAKYPKITDAKTGSANDNLRDERYWQALVDSAAVWIWETDADLKHTYCNAFVRECLGYDAEEFLCLDPMVLVHPDDLPRMNEVVKNAATRKMEWVDTVLRWKHKDGTWRHIESRGWAVFDAKGNFKGLRGIDRDITERVLAEQQSRDSEQRLRFIYDQSPLGIGFIDPNGILIYCNDAFARIIGAPRERLIGFNNKTDLRDERLKTAMQTALSGRTASFEGDYTTVISNKRVNIRILLSPIRETNGALKGIFYLCEDVTEQKKAMYDKVHMHELLRYIIEHTRSAVAVHDRDLKYIYVSQRYLDEYNVKERDVIGKHHYDVFPDLPQKWRDVHQRALKGEVLSAEDDPYEREDGSVEWTRWECRPWYEHDGSVGGIIVYTEVITKRKQAEEALRKRERQLAESQRIAHIGSWEHNLRSDRELWSDEMFRILDLDPVDDPPSIETFFERVHPEDLPSVKKAVAEAHANKSPYNIDFRIILGDGTVNHVHAQGELLPDEDGEKVVLSGTLQDISKRKEYEKKLYDNELLLRTVLDNVGASIFLKDEQYRYRFANRMVSNLFGARSEDIVGKKDEDFFSPGSVAEIMRSDRPVIEQGKTIMREEIGIAGPGKEPRTYWTIKLPLRDNSGAIYGLCGISTDITERKKAEDELLRSRQWLTLHVQQTPLAVVEFDMQGRVRGWNTSAVRIFGFSRDEAIGHHWHFMVPQDVWSSLDLVWEGLISQEGGSRSTNRNITKDGRMIYCEWFNTPLIDDQGNTIGVASLVMDVTERVLSDERIKQSEKFVRNILDTVDEGFLVIDRDYRIITANKAYCGQSGRPCDDIIGKHCYEVSHGSARPCYEEGEECAVRHAFETGYPHTAVHKHQSADGTVIYVETKAFPIRDDSGNVTSAIETLNNITEKHLLEEERLKTQKLESIGTLAGGIAHDFNNLLQGIFGYIAMAKMTLNNREKALSMLEQSEKALHLAVNLTSQLLTFSKGGKPVKKLIRLRPVVENAVRFALSGSHSGYTIDCEDDLWPLEADEGQLAQVIQNIVLNADEAMAGKGNVDISLKNTDLPAGLISGLPEGGQFVMIVIRDYGIGIPDDHLSRIFDPYFTTKHKGSGLGLATSYSIVRNHGGVIDVKSELNNGSTFTLYLPALKDALMNHQLSAPSTVGTRKGRILVMDDEVIVRTVARELITALGHEVETAQHGEEALKMFRQAREKGRSFDIVILDLTVRGGMGGEETISRLRDIDPEVIAVVSSGYADSPIVANYNAYGFSAILSKPYRFTSLKDCLTKLLQST